MTTTSTRRTAAAGRRPDIEKWLTDRGFSWEYRARMPLEEFDWEKSLRNQARLGNPLEDDVVERYKAALSNGDLFPGILAAEPKKGGLLIADGNHRYAAHLAAKRAIDAYVIMNATPQAITMLTFEANTKHGLPTSESERIHHALWLVDNGMTADDAAKRLGLKVHLLRSAANLNEAGRRADDAGIVRTDWDRLSTAAMLRLHQISTDEGFTEMAKLAISAKLSAADINAGVSEMAQLRSSRKQVEYVKALRDVYAERLQTGAVNSTKPHGRQARTPRQSLAMVLGQVSTLPSAATITERFTDDDKTEFASRVDEALERLTQIRKALVE